MSKLEYKFKTALGQRICNVLSATGIGTLLSVSVEENEEYLTVDIGPMAIPQYPINAVNRVETVKIHATDTDVPDIFCRDDFPIVPHLNVGSDGKKSLCLFDVSFREIQHFLNASVLLRRIVYWFEKTARGELHQPDQPLEPFFPYVKNDIIIDTTRSFSLMDFPLIRLKRISSEDKEIYQEIPLNANEGQIYAIMVADIQRAYIHSAIHRLPKSIRELDQAFDESILEMITRSISRFWKIKQCPELYKSLFGQKETQLRRMPVLVLVNIRLARKPEGLVEQVCLRFFQISGDFQRLYSSFGYKVKGGKLIHNGKECLEEDIPLESFNLIPAFDTHCASRINGISDSGENSRYVQIGVGALGSKIADNCIRSGFGRWTYIDPDIINPHNLARHCLTQDSIGKSKVSEMQKYARSLYPAKECVVKNVISADICDEKVNEEIKAAIAGAKLVVDCSASVAVERQLAYELAWNTRAMSIFLNLSATALVILLESQDRKITLDTLEMQYYRLLIQNSELHSHLKSEQRVLYSSTCRGSSSIYPNDSVSIFSGLSNKMIRRSHSLSEASVMIWCLNDLVLKKYEERGDLFQGIFYENWRIKISSLLIERLCRIRCQKLPNETGGVLVGTYDFSNRICYIVDTINAPPDSQEYPNAFIRGKNGLPEQIDHIRKVTVDNLTYIGEWHSHPTSCTQPSSDDRILLKSIAKYMETQSSPACMMIVGDDSFSIYLAGTEYF